MCFLPSDADWFASLEAGDADLGVEGVGGGEDLHVRSELGVRADVDGGDVEDNAVVVHVHTWRVREKNRR